MTYRVLKKPLYKYRLQDNIKNKKTYTKLREDEHDQ